MVATKTVGVACTLAVVTLVQMFAGRMVEVLVCRLFGRVGFGIGGGNWVGMKVRGVVWFRLNDWGFLLECA
jgi:hypothetical protein